MKRPTDQQIEAIARLKTHPDFQIFLGWIEESLHDVDKRNRSTKEDAVMRQLQGKAQNLSDLLMQVDGSHDAVERIRTNKR